MSLVVLIGGIGLVVETSIECVVDDMGTNVDEMGDPVVCVVLMGTVVEDTMALVVDGRAVVVDETTTLVVDGRAVVTTIRVVDGIVVVACDATIIIYQN